MNVLKIALINDKTIRIYFQNRPYFVITASNRKEVINLYRELFCPIYQAELKYKEMISIPKYILETYPSLDDTQEIKVA